VLIDAGDTNKGKVVLEALKRYNVQQLDYFIATHPHPDHIGGADEVIKATKVLRVIDNGTEPDVPESLAVKQNPKRRKIRNPFKQRTRDSPGPQVKFDYKIFTMSTKCGDAKRREL